MPPHLKQRRRNTPAKNPRKSGKQQHAPRTAFLSTRTHDLEDSLKDLSSENESENEEQIPASEDGSSEDDEPPPSSAYASLLQVLKSTPSSSDRPTKRRKLQVNESVTLAPPLETSLINAQPQNPPSLQGDSDSATLEAEIEDEDAASQDPDSDDEHLILHDPFEQHYATIAEADLDPAIAQRLGQAKSEKKVLPDGIRKVTTFYTDQLPQRHPVGKGTLSSHIKKRLVEKGAMVLDLLQDEAQDIAREIFTYKDVLYGNRSLQNAPMYRDLVALHTLNHILKTRDRVLKNNARLNQEDSGDIECRDQGFTRPKVLILLPTKQSCVRFIESLTRLSEPDQQENRSRFLDTFSMPEDDQFQYKPDDFRELFGGNHEEDFRVGLKFTRKTIKYFSGFYNSDIILASPLGLMRTITTGGGKKDDGKKHFDADFLSSIEIVIMDQVNAIEMQNWQHVDYVFSQFNQLPKESHGCDFARVRNWYLDGKAKYLRQNIMFADYLTPSVMSLASNHLFNVAGRVKYTPTYTGSMINLSPSVPFTLTQSFLRFDSRTPQTDSDSRFKFFTSTVLPSLLRSNNKAANRGTLIFVPTYLDFVRLRNHFSTAAETTSLAFGTISEYSSRGDVARARAHFSNARQSVVLYSERAHHYFRYKLKGIRRLIFYGVPENPIFWREMIDSLGMNAAHDLEWAQSQRGKQGKGLVRALFSKWDVMKLERIVGTERVGRLVSEREGDVFEFV